MTEIDEMLARESMVRPGLKLERISVARAMRRPDEGLWLCVSEVAALATTFRSEVAFGDDKWRADGGIYGDFTLFRRHPDTMLYSRADRVVWENLPPVIKLLFAAAVGRFFLLPGMRMRIFSMTLSFPMTAQEALSLKHAGNVTRISTRSTHFKEIVACDDDGHTPESRGDQVTAVLRNALAF